MPLPLSETHRLNRRADLAACQTALRTGSRSFFLASKLLPRTVREPACALYAFCRFADDAIDQENGGAAAVAMLRAQLDGIYAGCPSSRAVDRALADVVERYRIPRELLDALIEGFEWDAQARRYEDLAALEAYAMRVAGTVGEMMAMLMGVRDPAIIARACDLGVAMQLTNIARDVGEDARNGRLYLPLSWMREAGLDPDIWVASPTFSLPLARVVERLLRTAAGLYKRVDAGVLGLPRNCRPGINAARLFYAEIGHEVERAGFDSMSRRAVVPTQRKLSLLLRALVAPLVSTDAARAFDQTASEFRMAEATPTRAPVTLPLTTAQNIDVPWWNFRLRLIALLTMFERLERVDRRVRVERLGART